MSYAEYVTKVLTTIGDINPIDHGGGYVYVDTYNVTMILRIDEPEGDSWDCEACNGSGDITYVDADGDEDHAPCSDCNGAGEDPALRWTVYRVPVEYYDWVDWKAVATSCGNEDPSDYAKDAAPLTMAGAIQDAAGYDGWHAFDNYPDRLTRKEVEALCEAFDAV